MGLLDVGHDPALSVHSPPSLGSAQRSSSVGLFLVALTRPDFMPLQLTAPKFLAWKVFFLTLLTSGANSLLSWLGVFSMMTNGVHLHVSSSGIHF